MNTYREIDAYLKSVYDIDAVELDIDKDVKIHNFDFISNPVRHLNNDPLDFQFDYFQIQDYNGTGTSDIPYFVIKETRIEEQFYYFMV